MNSKEGIDEGQASTLENVIILKPPKRSSNQDLIKICIRIIIKHFVQWTMKLNMFLWRKKCGVCDLGDKERKYHFVLFS